MNTAQIEIQMIAALTAAACALPGVFLVLRRMSLVSDAISHAILPGIVAAFFITGSLASPLLVVAAALTGVLTVFLSELLNRTRLVQEDAAIGLVFPFLFSIGVILISRGAGNVHLDTDAVLLGEIAFAPFERVILGGWDIGPQSAYVMGAILILNAAFIILFFKELKVSTFDAGLAASLGFAPAFIHYALMALVSITAVGAFDAVGSVLVVALMIAPPSAAYLLTDDLSRMLGLSAAIGIAAAVGGFWLANLLDASIAGSMATMCGAFFGLAFLFAPQRGLLAQMLRRAEQRWEFAQMTLAIHLFIHEGMPEAGAESMESHLGEHLRWNPDFAAHVVRRSERGRYIYRKEGRLFLTDNGRDLARRGLSIIGVPQKK